MPHPVIFLLLGFLLGIALFGGVLYKLIHSDNNSTNKWF